VVKVSVERSRHRGWPSYFNVCSIIALGSGGDGGVPRTTHPMHPDTANSTCEQKDHEESPSIFQQQTPQIREAPHPGEGRATALVLLLIVTSVATVDGAQRT
jgi:hypothetical protein